MGFIEEFDRAYRAIEGTAYGGTPQVGRLLAELVFAKGFADVYPAQAAEWQPMVVKAAQGVLAKLEKSGAVDLGAVVAEAEDRMKPIGEAAKAHIVHCCGHAHIDMNWLWPWQETVSVTHDTFQTVDRLMDEFPEFRFSQSQASTYAAMEQHCPEIFEMVKRRIKEGRWECMASMWVEGDKNMASGEILCRHLLYTRRYVEEKLGLPYDSVKMNWECDTFGHCYTLPGILRRGGVTRYYRHRTGPQDWLTWWQGPDGSRVLAIYDKGTYNGAIDTKVVDHLLDYLKSVGCKEFLYVYGVGDHGGGPTRRDLMKARELNEWPIYPTFRMSTLDAFCEAVEKANPNIPVHDGEFNFVFEGCYTSQSNIKLANRVSENILPELEAISLVAGATAGFPYPMEQLRKGWEMAMFNQFHDILPGSGRHCTYEYSQGLFQEIQAIASAVRTRALRRLAAAVDTSAAGGKGIGDGIGAGAGDPNLKGGLSAYNVGVPEAEPMLVFNQVSWPRSEMVEAKIWNKPIPKDRIVVHDDRGNTVPAQVLKTGHYWGHDFTTVLFPATDVPATGYRLFVADRAPEPVVAKGVTVEKPGILENELLKVTVDPASGAIESLIDKRTGAELCGYLLGVLELCQEAPNSMSAWTIGQIMRCDELIEDGKLEITHRGPHRAAVKTTRKVKDSTITVEIGLNAGSPQIDFTVVVNWLEIGTAEAGTPMLRVAFDANLDEPEATYEIAFGSISRPTDGHEVPALRWADLSGEGEKGDCGITLVNDSKYGHSADDSVLRLTLLRSSSGPDPLPEMGEHTIHFALIPHSGKCAVSDAMRQGGAFNLPMNVVSTDVHKGPLPTAKGFVEVLTPNVHLAAVKKAEDGDAVIVRVYEVEGKATEARVRLTDIVKPGAPAGEVDLMERPLDASTARMEGDTLVAQVPAFGIASVAVG